ncbi:MAG TPA: CapA family protein [Saprospiraceae bacterium]|nr:CapA family protein [Saprospiraceae bacterium]
MPEILRFYGLLILFSIAACSGKLPDAPAIVKNNLPEKNLPKDTLKETPPAKLWSIIGVGDMMLGTNYPSPNYLPANDGKNLLDEVRDILRDADVTFGNHEGTILNSGGTPKTCRNPDACYVFRTPESYGVHFSDAGFDLMSVANNHSGDFGPIGRKRTKEVLREQGIALAGLAGTDEMAVIERNGLRFGFCAFAPNSGTCDIRNLAYAKKLVQKVAAESDIVIVSFHGGAEGATNQRVPRKSETYFGENRGNVFDFAHAVVDAGADIVFGHGPHVPRAIDLYDDRLICYSLGNFCTYGRFSLAGPAGFAPIVKVFVNEKGEFSSGEIIPVYQLKTSGPKIDSQKRATKKIIELTRQDFPDTPLKITETGVIERRQ